jgi:hypothetical protein
MVPEKSIFLPLFGIGYYLSLKSILQEYIRVCIDYSIQAYVFNYSTCLNTLDTQVNYVPGQQPATTDHS